ALRLPRIAVVHLEQPLAPCVERIVGLEEPLRRDDARPLERAEEDVISKARTVAREELVLHEHRPHRIERTAKRRQRALRIFPDLLERHAVALLARLAEVGLVLRMHLVEELEDDDLHDERMQRLYRPLREEVGERARLGAAEEQRPRRIHLVEIK